MAAVRVEGSEDGEGLLYKISEDGKDRGWKVELLAEPLFRVEEKLLLCIYCRGLVREACQCEINGKHVLSCNVCIPRSVAWQPSHLTREAINEKIVSKYMVLFRHGVKPLIKGLSPDLSLLL